MIAKSQSNRFSSRPEKELRRRADELTKELGAPIKIEWRTPNDEDPQNRPNSSSRSWGRRRRHHHRLFRASKVTRAIDDAIAKGVQVMCFDSDAPQSKRLCYVGTDDAEAGGW